MEAFTAIFEQGIKEGSFHPHNPAHTGRMFLGAFRELFELLASSASEEAANEYVEVLIGAALHGLVDSRANMRIQDLNHVVRASCLPPQPGGHTTKHADYFRPTQRYEDR